MKLDDEDIAKLKRGLRLMKIGYGMMTEVYDQPDFMSFEFPIDYEKLTELMRVVKEDLHDV